LGTIVSAAALQVDILMMTPLQFLEDPAMWLRCYGQLGCTLGAAPTFGYMHILNTVQADDVGDCRFDDWRLAFVATEPLRLGDLEAFVTRFAPLGFRRRALCPAYGLSETTLSATQAPVGRGPITRPDDGGPHALV